MLHTCGDPRRRPACAKARQGAADILIPYLSYMHMIYPGQVNGLSDLVTTARGVHIVQRYAWGEVAHGDTVHKSYGRCEIFTRKIYGNI